MNNNQLVRKMNLFDSLSIVNINKSNADYITDMLFDYHDSYPKNEIFVVTMPDGTGKLYAIKHTISVSFQSKVYPVAIVISLPYDFPNQAPNVYIDRSTNIGINPKCVESRVIDEQTFKINIPYLRTWKRNNCTLKMLLADIETIFNSVFPVYKNKEPQYNSSKLFACFNLQDKTMIDFSLLSSENIALQEINKKPKPKVYSDEEIKDLYMKELLRHLMPIAVDKSDKLAKDEETALKFKSYLEGGTEQMGMLLNNKERFTTHVDKCIYELRREINEIRNYLSKDTGELNLNNITDIVDISNTSLIQAVALEASSEDILLIVKKAFEKEAITLEETIRFFRSLSREIFKIKFFREKQMNNTN